MSNHSVVPKEEEPTPCGFAMQLLALPERCSILFEAVPLSSSSSPPGSHFEHHCWLQAFEDVLLKRPCRQHLCNSLTLRGGYLTNTPGFKSQLFLTTFVILVKLPNVCELHCPYLQNGDNDSTYMHQGLWLQVTETYFQNWKGTQVENLFQDCGVTCRFGENTKKHTQRMRIKQSWGCMN